MSGKQFGLSAQEIQNLKEQAAFRLKNREYFLKEVHNPYRRAVQTGGHLFDPALMRYHAMTEAHLEFFRPTPKTSLIAFAMTFGAIGAFAYLFYWDRETRFRKIREGQVPYHERLWKFH